jgi:membrane fusion protein, multidrug efflux system
MPVNRLVVASKSKYLGMRAGHERPRLGSLGLPLALSIICLAPGCSRKNTTRSETVRTVKTITIPTEDRFDVRSFPGRVEASKRVELAFQVPGVLVNLPVKEGQSVARGEIIAQLRSEGFKARLETVQGQLDQARAVLKALHLGDRPEEQLLQEAQEHVTAVKLANARTEFERYAQLAQSGAASRSEYDLAETNYLVAQEDHKTALQLIERRTPGRQLDIDAQEAAVRRFSGLVGEAKLRLEDCTLRAPFDGVVAERFVDEGQSITVNRPVVRFQSFGAIDIVVNVPAAVMTSDIRSRSIEGFLAEISGAPGRQYPVHIKEVPQVADATTRTFPVRFEMKPPSDLTVLPGMTATVTVSYRFVQAGDRMLAGLGR